jgi:hypothetical protein
MTIVAGDVACSTGLAARIFNNLRYDNPWQASTAGVAVGAVCCPTTPNGIGYRCSAITTGITGSSEPTWPLVLTNTVVDGGVTWTAQDVASPSGKAHPPPAVGAIPSYFGYVQTSSDLDGFRLLAWDIAKGVIDEVNANRWDGTSQVSGGGGGGGGTWSLATKPASPDSRDEEFEGAAFSGWTIVGTQDSTPIDPDVSFSTANLWRHSWNSERPSWLMLQTTNASSLVGIAKSITMGTNDMVWCGFSTNGAAGSVDGTVVLQIATAGGAANVAGIRVNQIANSVSYFLGGGSDVGVGYTRMTAVSLCPIHFMGIRKIGTTYRFVVADEFGSWYEIGNGSNASTPGELRVRSANSLTNAITGVDFVRFRAGAGYP